MTEVYIIAEAGVNHNGDIKLAKKLIDEGAKAGVNAVKFQTFKAENLVTTSAAKANYQNKNDTSTETQFEMLRKLELSYESFVELKQYCKTREVDFLTSAFDLDSIEVLEDLDIKMYKVPSGEITNLPYLRKIATTGRKVVLSTGMSTYGDIEQAISILVNNGSKEIVVLHCNTEYPTPFHDVNLLAMTSIKNAFNVEVGYSDHTLGIEVPIAAVALGATVIEKHFTLDKTMNGPDHKASLEPEELSQMVRAIRNIENALGDGVKRLSHSEKENLSIVRKSIVAKTNISMGELFTTENLTIKRPGTGISPLEWDNVLGTTSWKKFEKDEVIIR